MTKPPENWQAIAMGVVNEIDKQIYALTELRDVVEIAFREDDYQTFQLVLKYLGGEEK